MAKNESTAVNELIGLVQSGKKTDEPGDDLFRKPATSTRVSPPRVTTTVPPMRGAGEVAPLPRRRSASGTEGGPLPSIPPPVRMMTAPPTRGSTIPPIAPKGTPAPTLLGVRPPPTPPQRASSKAGLPPPTRTSSSRVPDDHSAASARASAPPPSMPVVAPFEARPSAPLPLAPPAASWPPAPRPPVDLPGDHVSADNWFQATQAADKVEGLDISFDEVPDTSRVQRVRTDYLAIAKKLAVPAAILSIVAVMVGGYFAFDGEGGKKHASTSTSTSTSTTKATPAKPAPTRVAAAAVEKKPALAAPAEPAPAPVAAPAPAPAPVAAPAPAAATTPPSPTAPVIREVATTRGVVKLVDIRVDSTPPGATVMLVDNGKTSFLGTTPVAASLDPSRAYDVILTLEGHPTRMAHVDPNASQHVAVALDKAPAAAKPAVAKQETPAPKKETPPPAPKKVADKPAPAPPPAEAPRKAEKKVAAAPLPAAEKAAAGTGTLAVSSKPPCEIIVDGKATGLSTPQRALALSAGAHKIQLVNAQENIKKQFAVAITAGQTTKLIKDFLK